MSHPGDLLQVLKRLFKGSCEASSTRWCARVFDADPSPHAFALEVVRRRDVLGLRWVGFAFRSVRVSVYGPAFSRPRYRLLISRSLDPNGPRSGRPILSGWRDGIVLSQWWRASEGGSPNPCAPRCVGISRPGSETWDTR